MAEKKKRITVDMPLKLAEQVKREARKQERTLSAQVRLILWSWAAKNTPS